MEIILSDYLLIPQTLSLEQFKLVAVHELAHVRRLDWLINLFSHLVGAIFFFHPFYHLPSDSQQDHRFRKTQQFGRSIGHQKRPIASFLADGV